METLKENVSKRREKLSPAARALLEKRLRGESGDDSRTHIPRRVSQERSPLSFAQQRLWFLNKLEPWSVAYNEFEINPIAGAVDVGLLERSLNEVVRRHEILRTVFLEEDGQPFQVILPAMTLSLPVVDIDGLPESRRQAEMRRLAAEIARQPFDLTRGPLLRAVLLRLGEEELILLRAMHHIICDGWSMGVLVREMMALCVAFSQGLPSPLSELPIQYADFATWQRDWLQGEVLEKQLAYWQGRLDGTSGVLELPVDHPRPPVPTYQGATRPFALSETLTGVLRNLCQREGSTLFMVLLAALDVLLWRHTGQEDVLVGTPVAGRNWVETEELIGIFINTLVLRADLSGNPSFREVLRQVREVTLEAYAHQDLPFEVLVGALRLERDTSRAPLVQALLSHQVIPDLAQDASSSGASEFRSGARVDLELQVMERSTDLSGYLLYNTDIFDDETIVRLLNHFDVLLESVAANPDQRIVDLPLLTEPERRQLLVAWNDTGMDYPCERCVHEVFEGQAARTPDRVAVVFAEQNLTYENLDWRTNQLGRYLQGLGVGPGVSVGICVERSLDMVVGVLGILKAGGNYVPLDPAHPDDRLTYILEDSQALILLTQQQVFAEKNFPGYAGQVVLLDEMWRTISREPETTLAPQASSQNLAYTIYTSGSTGRPKGVQVLHRAVVNFLTSMRWQPGFTDEDVLLAITTLCFDIAGLELFLPLVMGGRVVLLSHEEALEGGKLAARLADCGATKMQATPSTWQLLLESGWQGSEKLTALCGGEAFPRQLANRLIDRVAEVWNMYGPTETTIWSSIYPVRAGRDAIPIGRPVANTQFYVLNEHLKPAPIGVWGELYIGGDGLARGYLNRPKLTAEKFVPNPFSDEEGARLYRTGDVVRYLPDGNVEFLGRVDHQVKVHGHRIELAEIEVTLGQHPAVQQVVVVVQGSEAAKRLVAYVVAAEGQKPTVSDMSRFLGDRLPRYMVPSAFVELDAFPLTPNGKVDRRALPAPDGLRPELDVAYVAPQSTVERAIAEIWLEVLQVEQVGIHDNFFDVGGHSLLLTRVHNKLQAVLDDELSLMDLFNYPTVATLGEYLSQGDREQPLDRDGDRGEKLQDGQARLQQLLGRSAGAKTV